MNIQGTVRAWRQIENFLALVQDPILRNAMRYELEKRAVKEWGYCPAETQTYKEDNERPQLTDDEQQLADIIEAYLEYGVDVRTDEQKARAEHEQVKALNNMIDFINKGHTYWDIPENIRSDNLKAIYDKAFDIVFSPKITA